MILKNWNNNRMEEMGLVTPTPGLFSTFVTNELNAILSNGSCDDTSNLEKTAFQFLHQDLNYKNGVCIIARFKITIFHWCLIDEYVHFVLKQKVKYEQILLIYLEN